MLEPVVSYLVNSTERNNNRELVLDDKERRERKDVDSQSQRTVSKISEKDAEIEHVAQVKALPVVQTKDTFDELLDSAIDELFVEIHPLQPKCFVSSQAVLLTDESSFVESRDTAALSIVRNSILSLDERSSAFVKDPSVVGSAETTDLSVERSSILSVDDRPLAFPTMQDSCSAISYELDSNLTDETMSDIVIADGLPDSIKTTTTDRQLYIQSLSLPPNQDIPKIILVEIEVDPSNFDCVSKHKDDFPSYGKCYPAENQADSTDPFIHTNQPSSNEDLNATFIGQTKVEVDAIGLSIENKSSIPDRSEELDGDFENQPFIDVNEVHAGMEGQTDLHSTTSTNDQPQGLNLRRPGAITYRGPCMVAVQGFDAKKSHSSFQDDSPVQEVSAVNIEHLSFSDCGQILHKSATNAEMETLDKVQNWRRILEQKGPTMFRIHYGASVVDELTKNLLTTINSASMLVARQRRMGTSNEEDAERGSPKVKNDHNCAGGPEPIVLAKQNYATELCMGITDELISLSNVETRNQDEGSVRGRILDGSLSEMGGTDTIERSRGGDRAGKVLCAEEYGDVVLPSRKDLPNDWSNLESALAENSNMKSKSRRWFEKPGTKMVAVFVSQAILVSVMRR